jgi:predicted patatin/cPLA2 family phospholipase
MRSLITSGDYFNADFAYHVLPTVYDKFDTAAFEANSMAFYVTCTEVTTGEAVYRRLDRCDDSTFDWIRASASMPLFSRVIDLDGHKLLDGGVADSIPLAYFESLGYDRNVVVLTQPAGYQKEHNRFMLLMRLALRRYPRMIDALDKRHIMYNKQLEFVAQAEHEGRCLVIRPDEKIPIGHISHNPDQMRRVYDIGRAVGQRHIDRICQFYKYNH